MKIIDKFVKLTNSVQLITLSILLDFGVLATSFTDWDTTENPPESLIVSIILDTAFFLFPLLGGGIWLHRAMTDKCDARYFDHPRPFKQVSNACFLLMLGGTASICLLSAYIPLWSRMPLCLLTYSLGLIIAWSVVRAAQKMGTHLS